jgi:formylglycine-generating enzyme required for sulfatase activity
VLFLGLLLAWGITLLIKTREGDLVIDCDVPEPAVYVNDKEVTITWDQGGKKATIRVKPNDKVEVKKDGLVVKGEDVTVEEDGRRVLRARFNRNQTADRSNDNKSDPKESGPGAPAKSTETAKPSGATTPGTPVVIDLGNNIKMEFVRIPAGEFDMGSRDGDNGAYDDEKPQHRVRIVNDFYLGKYPVTQEQYRALTNQNPSYISSNGAGSDRVMGMQTDQFPIEQISHGKAMEYCELLTERHGQAGWRFKLPTEAQWEYACRTESGGHAPETAYYFGNDSNLLREYAWYKQNAGSSTHQVGTRKPNAWGLYDMHGNVWQWCRDGWHDSYNGAPRDGSAWLAGDDQSARVLRGGSWRCDARDCRSAARFREDAGRRNNDFGFRVALVSSPQSPEASPPKPGPAEESPKTAVKAKQGAAAQSQLKPEQDKPVVVDLGKGIKMEFVRIPAGEFDMGSLDNDPAASTAEKPHHLVQIAHDFHMGKYAVTQAQYRALTNQNPSHFSSTGDGKAWVRGMNTDQFPVERVSHEEAEKYCRLLTQKYGQGGRRFELPTEAQWEYACRAVGAPGAAKAAYSFGDNNNELDEYAWYFNNSFERTHKVGTRKPNAWGLYDMHGNVWHWCQDGWHNSYNGAPSDGSAWLAGSDLSNPVLRGGSWNNNARGCCSAHRAWNGAGNRSNDIGFRVVLVPLSQSAEASPPKPGPAEGSQKTAGEANEGAAAQSEPKSEQPVVVDLGNSIKMEFVRIPAGEFDMGSLDDDPAASAEEKPHHLVRIAQDFHIGKYPVTQAQYRALTNQNPSHFSSTGDGKAKVQGMDTDQFPVERVSHEEAEKYCRLLTQKYGQGARRFELPTEAQWEYACRTVVGVPGAAKTAYSFGDNIDELDEYAWYVKNPGGRTHQVGTRKPNSWGLYDMQGNVWQWCQDVGHNSYNGAPSDGSAWLAGGEKILRVLRGGGCWDSVAWCCRSASRRFGPAVNRTLYTGFRVVLVSP